jgi:CubicO group peptidase (beta-lactamase class C family)
MRRAASLALLIAAGGLGAEKYPTREWTEATPESQGVDSQPLIEMIDHVREARIPLHSILVVRHGKVVLDTYFYPYQRGVAHDVASVTKSVTSTLVGIAVDQGKLRSVQLRVADLLHASLPADPDPRELNITVEHLLTMSSGWNNGLTAREEQLNVMRHSPDWIVAALQPRLQFDPGVRFGYYSVNTHLLSAIMSLQTGENLLEFGTQYLFGPLGIPKPTWPSDPAGRSLGWADLRLTPREMAKLGYLFLHDGVWDGKQVVSKGWVSKAWTPFVNIHDKVSYGYGWWIDQSNAEMPIYEAVGRGGQRISVIPSLDTVVVLTSGGADSSTVASYLLRALTPENALAEAPARLSQLKSKVEAAAKSQDVCGVAAPAAQSLHQGVTYLAEPNELDLVSVSLVDTSKGRLGIHLKMTGQDWIIPVKLDDCYLEYKDGFLGIPMMARGHWNSKDDFLFDLDLAGNINHYLMRMNFVRNELNLTVTETTGLVTDLRIHAKAASTASQAMK